MRIAAAADVHAREGDEKRIRDLFARVKDHADVLILAGDLTDHGRPAEGESLVRGLHGIGVPVVCVFGNHDHEDGAVDALKRMMEASGLHILDRSGVIIDGVGFAGAKGFGGGFGDRVVRGFGEDSLKTFVGESVIEAESLRRTLRHLDASRKVAVLHYSPIEATLEGEPTAIYPFLGTSRLEQALDEGGARVAVHGHAHHGAPEGRTAGGTPVYNVSIPLLKQRGHEEAFRVFEV